MTGCLLASDMPVLVDWQQHWVEGEDTQAPVVPTEMQGMVVRVSAVEQEEATTEEMAGWAVQERMGGLGLMGDMVARLE